MARKITLEQAIREMREARDTAVPLAAMADPDHPFMCIGCNDETPIGCPVCRDESIEIDESFYEKRTAYYNSHPANHIIPNFCAACNDIPFRGCVKCNPDDCETPCGFWGPPVPDDSQHVVDARGPPRFPEPEAPPHSLLREDAFPPARDEPARYQRPPFLEPEPVSPRTTKRVQRAAAYARWRKGNGWIGPFVRFAGEDADDCYAE